MSSPDFNDKKTCPSKKFALTVSYYVIGLVTKSASDSEVILKCTAQKETE